MNLIGALGKLRKILGKVTDFMIKGRQAGLWSEGPTIVRLNDQPAAQPPSVVDKFQR